MVKFTIQREALLKPLQLAAGVVERKQAKPILSHLLLSVVGKHLTLIGTDNEVELHGIVELETKLKEPIRLTVPGKKFLDICKSLPEGSLLEVAENQGKVIVSCGRSRFTLTPLPATDFPNAPSPTAIMSLTLRQSELRQLIEKTSFAIPLQDVRQYLNGLLFEVKDGAIQTLATDGHRLAMHSIAAPTIDSSFAQVIIPKKGVFELLRLLENSEETIKISLNHNLIHVQGNNFILISKLISGKFPNYNKIIPKRGDKKIEINCFELKQALTRVGILSNEMFRSVQFKLRKNHLTLITSNNEQEEAIEEIALDHPGEELEITFNIGYLMDILNVTTAATIIFFIKQIEGGVVIEEADSKANCLYVLMPIRQ